MSERGFGVLLIAVVIAISLGLVMFVGAATARVETRERVFFGDRPAAAERTIAQIQERVPGAVRPLVPVQRQVAIAFREAAVYLLVLIGVAASLLFARGFVVAGYRATLGGWRTQLRTLGIGAAVLAAIGSALVLTFFALLGAASGPTPTGAVGNGFPERTGFFLGPSPVLQVGLTAMGVAIVILSVVVVLGLAAMAWRVGDRIVAWRPLARLGEGTPPILIALLGTSVIYVISQLPIVGNLFGLVVTAYALGVVAAARLAPTTAATA